jgi:hypothetical protein
MKHLSFSVFASMVVACSAGSSSGPAPSPAPNAHELLDRIDTRAPVPLLPMMANHQKQNMRDHLVVVQEIVGALAVQDYAGVERAAGRMGFSEQMGQMCSHMGAGAPGFAEQALAMHHAADRISLAARQQDGGRVLAELGTTLQSCTSCHAAWKQQVVDEASWQKLTAAPLPSHATGR